MIHILWVGANALSRGHHSSNALASRQILFKVSLRHEVLHLHIGTPLRQNDAPILLLNLEIGEISSWIIWSVARKKILIPCLICTLTVILCVSSY